MLALHAVLVALFIAVPLELRRAGLPVGEHWKVYLPVMLGSFVLMLPAIIGSGSAGRTRAVFLGSVAVLLAVQVALPWVAGGVWTIGGFLLVFFTAFNILEATLPSAVTRIAPAGARGMAIGVFTSLQFLGTFVGAVAGGYLYGRWGAEGIVIFDAALLVIWIVAAFGTRVPALLSTRAYALPVLDRGQADRLTARLKVLPGVLDARVEFGERRACLTVDSAGFDEQNVLELIAGK